MGGPVADALRMECLPGQRRLLTCTAPHILCVAGVASGKTQGGARWALTQMVQQPGAVGFIGAQSHNQLTRVSLKGMTALLAELGIPYVYGRCPPASWGTSRFPDHGGILSVDLGQERPVQVICGSMENYNAHRGIEVGWAWLDESRDMAKEAYDVILSRLRGQPAGTVYRTLNTTTPAGFGWLYDGWVLKPAPGTAVVRMRTSDNPFLPRGYVAALRAQYTEQYARQEVDGEFVNLTEGQVYHSFSRECVRPVVHDRDSPIWLTLDFNVAPLCAVYGQRFARSHRVLGEVHILASGRTADTAEEFARRMHEAGHRRKVVTVYGDTSGANRDTRSGTTDYAIIQAALMAKGWTVEVRRNYGNPDLVRSVESVNRLLAQRRLDIHDSAAFLCRDLEQVAWEPGTRLISKKNAQLTHLSDALRYYCSHIMAEEDVHGAKSMPF